MSQSATHPDELEFWLPVPGWQGEYDASSFGRIRSLDRLVICKSRYGGLHQRWYRGRILAAFPNIDGYLMVSLNRAGSQNIRRVHQLIAAAFIGPCPDGLEVCHGPTGLLDNRPENLCYGTRSKNNGADKLRDGTLVRGEASHLAKLTEEQVREIRRRYAAGESQPQIARAFGIGKAAVSRILLGKAWGHIPGAVASIGPARGEALPQTKLTPDLVREIRARRASGERQDRLAAEYGVSATAIANITYRRTWKHVA